MLVKELKLDQEKARLVCYLHEATTEMSDFCERPAVVICPGGGYGFCSRREADPIALHYAAAGFHSFVLYYAVGEDVAFPTPLYELSLALKTIRDYAEEWGVIPNKIAVCGFSAGGHLCASLGTLWNHPLLEEMEGFSGKENCPNAMILGYPVITTSWMENCGAISRILGEHTENLPLLSCQKQVGPHTPPAFIFHTYEDNAVPVEDSLAFATAMAAADVPFELHIFKDGGHGISLANPLTGHFSDGVSGAEVAEWMPMSCDWLWRLFGMPHIPVREKIDRAHPSASNR